MNTSLYAFYGSLRRGMRLHAQFKQALQYEYSVWLPGFDMFSLGNYPYIIKTENASHKILVEVTKVLDEETKKCIHDIEIEAGYIYEKINVGEDEMIIYLFKEPANNLRIESGDWVTFFGQ